MAPCPCFCLVQSHAHSCLPLPPQCSRDRGQGTGGQDLCPYCALINYCWLGQADTGAWMPGTLCLFSCPPLSRRLGHVGSALTPPLSLPPRRHTPTPPPSSPLPAMVFLCPALSRHPRAWHLLLGKLRRRSLTLAPLSPEYLCFVMSSALSACLIFQCLCPSHPRFSPRSRFVPLPLLSLSSSQSLWGCGPGL